MHVLIVDDSQECRRGLARLIGTLGEVKIIGEAGSVWEANQLLAQSKPDAVVLDLKLPGGSGLDVLSEIKKDENPPLVMVLTNYASEHYRRKSLEAGADYFFDKSTEFEEVLTILKMKAAEKQM